MNQYRIWDRVEERWLDESDKVYISLKGTLHQISWFRKHEVNNRRYLIYQLIGKDISGEPLYEGDIAELTFEGKKYTCLIIYVQEIAGYALIDCSSKEHYYFTFSSGTRLKKLGNILENYQLINNQDLFQAAQKNRKLEETEQ